MELWEVLARESIRDLVVRYNSNGDSGRFEQTLALFADDAVMAIEDEVYDGKPEILTVFNGSKEHLTADTGSQGPTYVRHHTSTHQIDLVDETHATGRCYFNVITSIGLDHWGRYVDEYVCQSGQWLFSRRQVTVDGQVPHSLFPPTGIDV